MNFGSTFFWFFSIAMLLCGVLVITNRNPVNSAMFLVMLFGFMAGLFVLLEAFFLAVIQVLVYAGAVMVLFLFVIMLLDVKASQRRKFQVLAGFGAVVVASAFIWELSLILQRPIQTFPASENANGALMVVLKVLFANYMLPVEITALLLLVAIIGVVRLSAKDAS